MSIKAIGFKMVEDSFAIARQSNTFKQLKIFERKGECYLGVSGGYVKMREDGATSHPKIVWDEAEINGKLIKKKAASGGWAKV